MKTKKCKTCPEIAPGTLAETVAGSPAAAEECHCVKWQVEITAHSVKHKSCTLYKGAVVELCEETADAMVAGGDAVKLAKIY